MAKHLNDGFASCFGQVSGTGTNTCAAVPGKKIEKIKNAFDMIVNFEEKVLENISGIVGSRNN